jgi:AcrR family transcriptional regulator
LSRRLSRPLIVDATVRIVDAEGTAGVTMRRVAEKLGTGPASLYAYVSGREELLCLALEQVMEEIRLPGRPDAERWPVQLREFCREIRRVYAAHRDLAGLALDARPTGPNGLRVIEALLAILRAGGTEDRVAASVARLLLAGLAAEGVRAPSGDACFTFGLDLIVTGLQCR